MKTKSKNLLISFLSLIMVLCLALTLGFGMDSNTTYATTGTSDFYVENGASVRTVEGSSGIRFTVKISEDYYAEKGGESSTWGVIIGKNVENAGDLNANNGKSFPVSADKIILKNGMYTIQFAINYDNASDFTGACNTMLNARAYVTTSTETFYSEAETDTYRSIKGVAEEVLVDDAFVGAYDGTAQRTILQSYVTGIKNAVISETVAYSEDMFATGEKKLTGVDVSNGTYNLTLNGSSLGEVTVTDGVISLGTETVFANAGCTLGNDYSILLTTSDKTYVQPFKYVSDTISTSAEFKAMTQYYRNKANNAIVYLGDNNDNGNAFYNGTTDGAASDEGFVPRYYILVNDIKKDASASNFTMGAVYAGFYDVLDGNGYTVTYTAHNQMGVFGEIYGTVKNISFNLSGKIFQNSYTKNVVLASTIYGGAVVENVYIDISKAYVSSTGLHFCGLAAKTSTDATVKDLYINVGAGYAPEGGYALSNPTTHGGYIGYYLDGTFTNVRVVSTAVTGASVRSGSVHFWAKNDTALKDSANVGSCTSRDVYRYDTAQAMIDAGVSKVGNWVVATDGSATWDDGDVVSVDKESIDVDETATLSLTVNGAEFEGYIGYSVSGEGQVAINGKTITGVSAGDVTISVAYQVNGIVTTKTFTLTVAGDSL